MKDTTLVIMAAGIGSRFGGGIKQLEPVGPRGEIIMDYSVYDALKAGFNKVVFVIRRDLEKDFKEIIGNRIEKVIRTMYAYQEMDRLPRGFSVPENRKKPWGTGHAVLSIKGLVNEPFLVINADDYYGREGFRRLHDYMVQEAFGNSSIYDLCMAGFMLTKTLSENGGVSRGVCEVDEDGYLKSVKETYEIQKKGEAVSARDEEGNPLTLSSDCYVSMNMWGFPPAFIEELEKNFPVFLASLKAGDVKSEYLLPKVIDHLVETGKARVKLLETPDRWFGVTYKEDKQMVVDSVKALIASGVYPENLYEGLK